MGTNCATLVADLFLLCYERDFMMSLADDKQVDIIYAFITTSRYLDDILNIDNAYLNNMVSQIYPSELQLNKANTSSTKTMFLDLHFSISNNIVSTKITYGVYISQLIRCARASSHVADFNIRNKLLTQKPLKQG